MIASVGTWIHPTYRHPSNAHLVAIVDPTNEHGLTTVCGITGLRNDCSPNVSLPECRICAGQKEK